MFVDRQLDSQLARPPAGSPPRDQPVEIGHALDQRREIFVDWFVRSKAIVGDALGLHPDVTLKNNGGL